MKYTIFYDQINRTNLQIKAGTPEEAIAKADKIYRQRLGVPSREAQEGWLVESDGEEIK